MTLKTILAVTCLATVSLFAADEKAAPAKPRAARSVHLGYSLPDGKNGKTKKVEVFYNEAVVEQSTSGSYFCASGFNVGYFGIQELGKGKKVVIFSLWDPGKQNDPKIVKDEERVKVLYGGENVNVSRFGGEGTGGKSMFYYDWKSNEPQRFLLKASTDENSMTVTAWFYLNDKKEWKKLATFQTRAGKTLLRGLYSFVEDFRRDGKSAEEVRRARYGNGWVRTSDGEWLPVTKARFTGDGTTKTDNNDAGVAEQGDFYLATGGDVKRSRELNSTVERKAGDAKFPPEDLKLPDEVINPKKI